MSTPQTKDQRRKANEEFLENTLFKGATDHRSKVFSQANEFGQETYMSQEDTLSDDDLTPSDNGFIPQNNYGYDLSDSGISLAPTEPQSDLAILSNAGTPLNWSPEADNHDSGDDNEIQDYTL